MFALVREDGLSQVEVAGLLGRHKSWVHRRLALLERLCDEGRGRSAAGAAERDRRPPVRAVAHGQPARGAGRLPARAIEHAGIDRNGRSAAWPRRRGKRRSTSWPILAGRLRQAQGYSLPSWDPRLSAAANRASKQLGALLDGLSRMENWLRHRGRADLTACDGACCGRRLKSSAPSAGWRPNWPKTCWQRWYRVDLKLEERSLGLGLRKGPAGAGVSRECGTVGQGPSDRRRRRGEGPCRVSSG